MLIKACTSSQSLTIMCFILLLCGCLVVADLFLYLYNNYQVFKTTKMKSSHLKHYDHIVCGGGLVGALWALFLRKRSHSIAVFESYWDLRQ